MSSRPQPPLIYPPADKGTFQEERHGRVLSDPYQWLEGEDAPVQAWSAAEQSLADRFFETGSRQAEIHRWLAGFLSKPFVYHAIDTARRRFMLEERPDLEQPLVIATDFETGGQITVVGPDDLARDPAGSVLAQDALFPSPCGRYLAYAVRAPGEDFASLRLKDVDAGQIIDTDFPLTILPAVSWNPDGASFFYNQNQGEFIPSDRRASLPDGVYRRRLGVAGDFLVHGMDWPAAHTAIPTVSDDGGFLFVNQLRVVADVSALSVIALADGGPAGAPIGLVEPGQAAFSYLGSFGERHFFETNLGDAPDGRAIAFDLARPDRPKIVEIVAEQSAPLARSTRTVRSERSILSGERLYLTYIDRTHHRMVEYDLAGRRLGELALPAAASVGGGGGDRYGSIGRARDGGLLIDLWTFVAAPRACVFDPVDGDLTAAASGRAQPRLADVDVRQIDYPSFDGTLIPASLIALKDTARDGSAPCLLYGYGGAGTAITPEFALDIVGWVAMGGIYMLANIRGGGELGVAWSAPSKGPDKRVTHGDFCAAAEWLITQGLARPESLGIRGISYGGLLVGSCLTQRPDLFGAVVAELPLLDPLSIGKDFWSAQLAPEIGDPVRDEAAFEAIARYAPLHNLAAGVRYPPTLVVAGAADAPLLVHGARKFVASLQSLDREGGPHLFHVMRDAGHGGWSKTQQLDTASRELAFLAANLAGRFRPLETPT